MSKGGSGSRVGRQEPWRRLRLRRLLAAALASVAVVVALTALRPAAEPTRDVVVAKHPLASGAKLTPNDLDVRPWPARLAPDGAPGNPAALTGQRLVGPVAKGEILSRSRLASPRGLPPLRQGEVVVSVTTRDLALARLLVPGDRVDAYAASGQRVATAARVLRVDLGHDTAEDGATSPAHVLLAAPSSTAAAVASAGQNPAGARELLLALYRAE